MRPLFQLGARLQLCAELTRQGRKICDVGTDHGYLPIWLIKSGKAPCAAAGDLREGPLSSAAANAKKYGVEDKLTLRLSDGLREFSPDDGDDIVMAGMGGELILRIVGETYWLKNSEKRLVLQPMTSVPELRAGLSELGFYITEEHAVTEGAKVYSAFAAYFDPEKSESGDPLFPYMGRLTPYEENVSLYAEKMLKYLTDRLSGAKRGQTAETPEEIEDLISQLKERYL